MASGARANDDVGIALAEDDGLDDIGLRDFELGEESIACMTGSLEKENSVSNCEAKMEADRGVHAQNRCTSLRDPATVEALRATTCCETISVSTEIVRQAETEWAELGEIKILAWAGMGQFPDLHSNEKLLI